MTRLTTTIAACLAFGIFVAAALAVSPIDNEYLCKQKKWSKIDEEFYSRSGCLSVDDVRIKFQQFAFDLSQYELDLTGSGPDGKIPQLSDVSALSVGNQVLDYSLQAISKPSALLIASAGYPIDSETFAPYGLVRIDGDDVSERDLESSALKTAMICLNEGKYNTKNIGSRIVIFNAFEKFKPIKLNDRLMDKNSCKNVIQAGPRIVEYKAKRGIKSAEKKYQGQKYLTLSQGNGYKHQKGGYYGYITYFVDKINLFDAQEFFLSSKSGLNGEIMRVSVVLTSGNYASVSWKPKLDSEPTYLGNHSKPHPTFITISRNN